MIGRAEDQASLCVVGEGSIRLACQDISYEHATLKAVWSSDKPQLSFVDLDSTNGTTFNYRRLKINESVTVSAGDELILGKFLKLTVCTSPHYVGDHVEGARPSTIATTATAATTSVAVPLSRDIAAKASCSMTVGFCFFIHECCLLK